MWDHVQRDRIERATQHNERNPPRQDPEVDPQAQMVGAPGGFEAAQIQLAREESTTTFSTGSWFALDIINTTSPVYSFGSSILFNDIWGPPNGSTDPLARNPVCLLKKPGIYLFTFNVQCQFPANAVSTETIELELRLVSYGDETGQNGHSVIGRSVFYGASDNTPNKAPTMTVTGFASLWPDYLPVEVRLYAESTGTATIYEQNDITSSSSDEFGRTKYHNRSWCIYTPLNTHKTNSDANHGIQTTTGPGEVPTGLP